MALTASSDSIYAVLRPGTEARAAFPFFDRKGGKAYLDSAATTQKPARVIDRLSSFLSSSNASVHRGAYELSAAATADYEKSRETLAEFINAPSSECVIFTRGTTDSINTVAASFGERLPRGATILLTGLEHHSNIVPWQLLAKRRGLRVEFADVLPHGEPNLEDLFGKLRRIRPALCAVTQLSNVTGAVLPVAEIAEAAHAVGSKILVDAAQSAPHLGLDVQELGVDFAAFSAHKMYGPTGVGCLYARRELLDVMEPVQGGGGMIETVTTSGSTWAKIPQRFEAGTPPIAEVIAWREAVEFLRALGLGAVQKHEDELISYAFRALSAEAGVTIHGPLAAGRPQSSIISFTMERVHAHDLATFADSFGVQIRAGHHCAMPLMRTLGLSGTARLSVGVYSINDDIDALVEAVRKARKVFA